MARLFRCDRCRRYYDQEQIDYIVNEMQQDNQAVYWLMKSLPPVNANSDVDLCPDCLTELRDWFKRGDR